MKFLMINPLETLLIIIVFIPLLYCIFKYYSPKIDTVISDKEIIVYLWYNKWEDNSVTRQHKKLFKIKRK